MPELNFNLLNPSAELYSGPQVKLDPQAAYDTAQAQQQSNMLSQLYAKHYDPQTGGINYNSLIGEAAQNPLTAKAIPKIMEGAQSQAQSLAEIEKNKAAAAKSELETQTTYNENRHKEVQRAIRDISNYANKADALNGIEKSYEAGKIDDDAYNNLMNMVRNEPIWARSQGKILQSLMTESAQHEAMLEDEKAKAPKWEERTDNRQKWYEDINPLSATAGQRRSSVSMQTTPGQAQTAAEKAVDDTGITKAERNKREAAFPKANAAFDSSNTEIDSLVADLTALANHPGLSSITGARAGTELVKGITTVASQDAADAQTLLDKIKSKGTLRALVDLRNNSPTGAALSNVSDADVRLLTTSFGNLNTKQATPTFKNSLDDIISQLSSTKTRLKNAYDETYSYRSQNAPAGETKAKVSGKGTKDDPIKLD